MGYSMPIIKHLWTSSMVLWAGGWSLLLLALFYGVLDILGWRRWSFFFVVIGANAIVAYMLQPLFDFEHIGRRLFGGLSENFGVAGDFVLALLTFALLWAGLHYLYRKRIFVKV
jgi:predicted acyltransferase